MAVPWSDMTYTNNTMFEAYTIEFDIEVHLYYRNVQYNFIHFCGQNHIPLQIYSIALL